MLECSVPADVAVRYCELDYLRRTGGSDQRRNDNPSVVRGLDLGRLRWVQCGAVDNGAIQSDWLELYTVISRISSRTFCGTYEVVFETDAFVEEHLGDSKRRGLQGVVNDPKGRTSGVAHAWSTMASNASGLPAPDIQTSILLLTGGK